MGAVSASLGLRKLREAFHGFKCSMRSASLMGRAFSLLDRGRLEEALVVCSQALHVAQDPRVGAGSPVALSTIVVGALTLDELATRLGTPELARGPLEEALRRLELLEQESVRELHPGKDARLLAAKEKAIRTRLKELGPTARSRYLD